MPKEQPNSEPITQSDFLAALSLILEQRGTAGATSLDGDGLASAIAKALNDANIASERRGNPNNPNPPKLSVFSYPEGDAARPKPFLTRKGTGKLDDDEEVKVYHNYGRCREDQLTPFEIEVCNALIRELPSRDSRRESRGGRWYAEWDKNNQRNLHIITPAKNVDDRTETMSTSFVEICMELAKGQRAGNTLDLLSRVAELEAKLGASAVPA